MPRRQNLYDYCYPDELQRSHKNYKILFVLQGSGRSLLSLMTTLKPEDEYLMRYHVQWWSLAAGAILNTIAWQKITQPVSVCSIPGLYMYKSNHRYIMQNHRLLWKCKIYSLLIFNSERSFTNILWYFIIMSWLYKPC